MRTLPYSVISLKATAVLTAVLAIPAIPAIPASAGPSLLPDMAEVTVVHPGYRIWAEPAHGMRVEKNPPVLTWPIDTKGPRTYAVRLFPSGTDPEESRITAEGLEWALFNPAMPLESGTWSWQVRQGDGPWSATHAFTVDASSQRWNPPSSDAMIASVPVYRPRLLVDAPEWETFRERARQRPEVRRILQDADQALVAPLPEEDNGIHNITGATPDETRKLRLDASEVVGQSVYNAVRPLCEAYVLTEDKRYAETAIRWALEASTWDPEGVTHLSNFSDSRIMLSMAMVLDTCDPFLSPEQRSRLVQAIGTRAHNFFTLYVATAQELKGVSGHFWQHILHYLFDTAIVLRGEDPRADRWLAFCYETFLARAPRLGGEDGGWAEGISYFRMNMEMLIDIPWRIKHFTGFDFIAHTPWYAQNTDLLLYAFPPGSASAGFADNTHDLVQPRGDYFAYADVLGRLLQNPYASWYHERIQQITPELTPQYQAYWRYHNVMEWDSAQEALGDTRLFRWKRLRYLYDTPRAVAKSPADLPMARAFKGEGLVTLHGQPLDADIDSHLFFAMRSSPMGASGHMLADQNCFNIVYGGERLFYHTGYKVAMSAPHRRQYYMTTKSHNGILVDGEGQPFEPDAYGWVEHFMDHDALAYTVGNASHAYDSEEAGKDAGVTLFRRHVVLLRPDIIVIYDELEAEKPVTWTYLLHSYAPIVADGDEGWLSTANGKGTARVRLCAGAEMDWTVTDAYPVPARNWRNIKDENGNLIEYPDNAWHFSATTKPAERNRFIAVYKMSPKEKVAGSHEVVYVETAPGHFTVDGWEIEAELAGDQPAGLRVKSADGSILLCSAGVPGPGMEKEGSPAAMLWIRGESGWTVTESLPECPPGAEGAMAYFRAQHKPQRGPQ